VIAVHGASHLQAAVFAPVLLSDPVILSTVAALGKGEETEGAGQEEEEEEAKITTGLDVTFAGDGDTAQKIKSQQEVTMNAWVEQQMGDENPEGDQADKGPVDHRAELFDVEQEEFKEVCAPPLCLRTLVWCAV